MKKLLRNIALLLLPILLYYGIFIMFEPNNYFGLHKAAAGTDIMAALRNYEDAPTDALILGDSRLAKFDMQLVGSIANREYANLAYGGASLNEQLDILDWAREQNPQLKQVVFMLSFYNLNQAYAHNRMVIDALNNPFVYLTNLGYNINMLTELAYTITGVPTGGDGETMNPTDYTYVDFTVPATGQTVTIRQKIASHLGDINERCQNWALNTGELQRLLQTIDDCQQQGIEFIIVMPPAHPDTFLYVVNPYGINGPMQTVLAQLKQSPALLLNYEFEPLHPLRDDQFYDCFHLDMKRGLPQWTEELFTDIQNGGQT
ncbi:hypothetical protein LJC61_07750 [Ruminococcaceae bacterium OttesenSCG-928-A16]|nr:hypothetical protein [Ruminococcaceae bacterium OttesenSCG-928-A16]